MFQALSGMIAAPDTELADLAQICGPVHRDPAVSSGSSRVPRADASSCWDEEPCLQTRHSGVGRLGPCRAVVSVVAANSGIEPQVLLANRRCIAPVALARQLAMYLAHVGLGLSQSEVARAFGRDRSTVAHACRRIEDLRDRPAFDRLAARLEACVRWSLSAPRPDETQVPQATSRPAKEG